MEGVVIALGDDERKKNEDLKRPLLEKGDKVLFSKWGGTEVVIEKKEYLIIKKDDILGIFK
jgi:chaperonin GroES